MLTKDELPICPVANTVNLIGNKWKLLIIRNLLAQDKVRFKDLKNGIDGISQKVLTDDLRSLEAAGLIIRTAYQEIPPRVEYELSPLGKSLRPIIDAMATWGNEYLENKK